jgi:hypothetical protein
MIDLIRTTTASLNTAKEWVKANRLWTSPASPAHILSHQSTQSNRPTTPLDGQDEAGLAWARPAEGPKGRRRRKSL